jgi:tetratricopeptide (TPR) repeat protein
MGRPLLDLEQEWHRQRAQLRTSHQRPPPLVTAGLELVHDPAAARRTRVQVAGMALIFGLFPPTVADFIELARNRLRLGRDPARQELQNVLGTRIQALWAWLPTLQQDCYGELDHATDEARLWMIGPGSGEVREVDLEREREGLDAAFLAALVMNGSRHWGGQQGLAQLVVRFGKQALLVAAQVAESLEREPRQPAVALALARTRWPQLDSSDSSPWELLVESEPPWACVQLGRLALRLGLLPAARRLLDLTRLIDAGAAAWHDLAVACEQLDDLAGAEAAWTRAAQQSGDDLEAWRRLVLTRLRLGLSFEASEALRRLRAAGGIDGQLIDAVLGLLRRPRLPLLERAHLAGWSAGRLAPALAEKLTLAGLLAEIARGLPAGTGERIDAALAVLRGDLARALAAADGTPAEAGAVDAVVRVVLLALPFLGGEPASRLPSQGAAHALLACRLWSESALGQGRVPDSVAIRSGLLELARLALGAGAENG